MVIRGLKSLDIKNLIFMTPGGLNDQSIRNHYGFNYTLPVTHNLIATLQKDNLYGWRIIICIYRMGSAFKQPAKI